MSKRVWPWTQKMHAMPIHVQTRRPESRHSTKTPGQQYADHRPGTPNVKGAWQQLLWVSRAANSESTRHWITGKRIGRRIRGKERTVNEQWSPTHEAGGIDIKAEGNASRGQIERERTRVRSKKRVRIRDEDGHQRRRVRVDKIGRRSVASRTRVRISLSLSCV